MDNLIKAIPVKDRNGDEMVLYEYQQFEPHLTMSGLDRRAGAKRFALDTGELVRRIDEDTFEIVATGEALFKFR
jgi:hypothetical protein